MASNLGEAILKFTAKNQTGAGIASTEKSISKAEKSIGGIGSKIGKGLSGGAGALLGIGKNIGGTIATGMGIGIGINIAESVGGLITKGFERIPELAQIGKIASNQIGIDAGQFSGIVGLAKSVGGGLEDVSEAFVNLADRSRDSGGDVADTFNKLGLSQAEFAKQDPAQQFFSLFDALQKLPTPMERMIALSQLVGEGSAKKLAPLLGMTSAQLKEQSAQFARSNTEIAAATVANEAMTRASAALEKAQDLLVISLEPVFTFISELIPPAIEALSPLFQGFGSAVLPVMRGTAKAIGYVWDVLRIGINIVALVQSKIIQGFAGIIEALARVVDLAKELPDSIRPDWVGNLADGIHTVGKDIDAFGKKVEEKSIENLGNNIANFGESAEAMDKFFNAFETRRAKAIERTTEKLQKSLGNPDVVMKGSGDEKQSAIVRGSAEGAALAARFQFASDSLAQKQLDQQKQFNENIKTQTKVIKEGLAFGVV